MAEKTSIILDEEIENEISELAEYLGLENKSAVIRFAVKKLYNENQKGIIEKKEINNRISPINKFLTRK